MSTRRKNLKLILMTCPSLTITTAITITVMDAIVTMAMSTAAAARFMAISPQVLLLLPLLLLLLRVARRCNARKHSQSNQGYASCSGTFRSTGQEQKGFAW